MMLNRMIAGSSVVLAWREAGLLKLPELGARLEVDCFTGRSNAGEALANMRNFNAVGFWGRWWNTVN